MISGLMGAFVAANADRKLEAAAACICTMGICGERAVKSLGNGEGNITLRNKIIDGFMNIDDNVLQTEAKIELR